MAKVVAPSPPCAESVRGSDEGSVAAARWSPEADAVLSDVVMCSLLHQLVARCGWTALLPPPGGLKSFGSTASLKVRGFSQVRRI